MLISDESIAAVVMYTFFDPCRWGYGGFERWLCLFKVIRSKLPLTPKMDLSRSIYRNSQLFISAMIFQFPTHRIYGTGIFTYIYHTNQPSM